MQVACHNFKVVLSNSVLSHTVALLSTPRNSFGRMNSAAEHSGMSLMSCIFEGTDEHTGFQSLFPRDDLT